MRKGTANGWMPWGISFTFLKYYCRSMTETFPSFSHVFSKLRKRGDRGSAGGMKTWPHLSGGLIFPKNGSHEIKAALHEERRLLLNGAEWT
jgi:hypothetical protein